MSNGLGDYIHHHAEGYQKYGINKPETSSSSISFGAAIGEAHAQINGYMQMAKINSSQVSVKTLEDLFTYMQGGTPRNGTEISQKLQEYLKYHGDIVKEAFKNLHPGAIVTDGLNVKTSSQKGLSSIKLEESAITKGKMEKSLSHIKKMTSLLRNSRSVIRNSGLTMAEIESLISQLQESKKIIQNAVDSLGNKSQRSQYSLGNGQGSVRSAIEDMNSIIETYFEDPRNLKGELLEMYFGALQRVGSNVFKKSKADLLKILNVKGQNTSKSGFFNIDISIQDALLKELNGIGEQEDSNNTKLENFILQNEAIIQMKESQTSVDVTIDSTNLDYRVKNILQLEQDLNISAKNYSSFFANRYGFKIISETNLLSTLQLIGTNFGNHLLNILGNQLEVPSDAIKVVKATLAVRGLLGVKAEDTGINTTNMVDVFATNINNSVGGIKFITTYDLMTKIYRDMNLITMNDLPSSLQNDWVGKAPDWGKAEIRIARLLTAAHATKLSAHLALDAMGYS